MNPHVGHDFCEYRFVGLSAFCLRIVAHLPNAIAGRAHAHEVQPFATMRQTESLFLVMTLSDTNFPITAKMSS